MGGGGGGTKLTARKLAVVEFYQNKLKQSCLLERLFHGLTHT